GGSRNGPVTVRCETLDDSRAGAPVAPAELNNRAGRRGVASDNTLVRVHVSAPFSASSPGLRFSGASRAEAGCDAVTRDPPDPPPAGGARHTNTPPHALAPRPHRLDQRHRDMRPRTGSRVARDHRTIRELI